MGRSNTSFNTTVYATSEGTPGETDQSPRRDDSRDQSPTTTRDHLQRLGVLRAVPTDEQVNQRTFSRWIAQPIPFKGHEEFVNPKLLTKWLLQQQLQPPRQSRPTLRTQQLQPRGRHKPNLRIITDASWHGAGTTTFRGNDLLCSAEQRNANRSAMATLLATMESLAQQRTVMVMTDNSASLKTAAGRLWCRYRYGLTMRYRRCSSHAPEERP